MQTVRRTTTESPDFIALVQKLDADLAITDGDEHAFYNQFNKLDAIKHAVIAYSDGKPVGCGAIKKFNAETMEIKRMYVQPSARGTGIAPMLLTALESWAAELGHTRCILETGTRQPAAIGLYKKSGYRQTANYGQYAGVENSLCFEKVLRTVEL